MITPFISHLELITPMELVPSQGLSQAQKAGDVESSNLRWCVFRKDRDVFFAP
jgi:hypothetical protein